MNTLQKRLRANPLPLPNVMELCREAADRIDALEAVIEQARGALEEMQYARTDKAERLTTEALRKIEEVRKC